MSRFISILAIPGIAIIGFRNIPVIWDDRPLDAIFIAFALLTVAIIYLETLMGVEL